MITYKTQKEIELIRKGGKILAGILKKIQAEVRVGVSTKYLNDLAVELARKEGASPSFLGYREYPASLCVSINEEIVHGIPDRGRILKDGDLVGLDLGLKYPDDENGLYTDMSVTVGVGKISKLSKKLIQTTREALEKGISQVKPGNYIQDISKAIQEHVEKKGFSVVRDLVGHGVGFAVHEDPQVPNFYNPQQHRNLVQLKPGMVIAIEPMVIAGDWRTDTLQDGWTVVSVDRSPSAHFEHTVAVTEKGCEVLTKS